MSNWLPMGANQLAGRPPSLCSQLQPCSSIADDLISSHKMNQVNQADADGLPDDNASDDDDDEVGSLQSQRK